jgi:hypothetical protein
MKRIRERLTFANVVACIALFVALGGVSYAATQLPKNSVGSKQLKKNAVTTAKIKNGAVTGSKIQTSSLGTVPSATNAEQLGGAGPSAYQGRIVQATPPTFTLASLSAGVATDVTYGGPLSITVPSGAKFVDIDASASFTEPAGTVQAVLWIAADAPNCSGTSGIAFENRVYGEITNTAGSEREVLTYHLVLPATVGVHTYRLCAYSGSNASKLYTRQLTVMTVEAGPTG